MVRLQITSDKKDVAGLIRSAIEAEIKRLEFGLNISVREIKEFENRYKVPSEVFLTEYTSEDLQGGDEEYVKWMGEIKIKERISENLNELKEIEYVA